VVLDYNSEGSGHITFEQFIHLLTPRLLQEDSRENIDKIFALFDTDKTGYISVQDLRRIAHELGQELTDQDFNDMIARADEDKDGRISS
jgi:centrin-1